MSGHAPTPATAVRAFRMKLKPGAVAEYRRRHDEIWPELSALLTDAGIHDYRIFLDAETLHLFAVLRLRPDERLGTLSQHPVMRRWWEHMSTLLEMDSAGRPREWPLVEVFHHA